MAFPKMSNSRRAYPGYTGDKQERVAPARIGETRAPTSRDAKAGTPDRLNIRRLLLAQMKGAG